jgi:hypothetical protein
MTTVSWSRPRVDPESVEADGEVDIGRALDESIPREPRAISGRE